MPTEAERQFNEAMLDFYRQKAEAGYNATRFLSMGGGTRRSRDGPMSPARRDSVRGLHGCVGSESDSNARPSCPMSTAVSR
jgi:hypothetical protein